MKEKKAREKTEAAERKAAKQFSKQHSAEAWRKKGDENYLSFKSPMIQDLGNKLENQRLQGKQVQQAWVQT